MRKLLLSTLLLTAVSLGVVSCNQNNTTVNPNTNNNNNTVTPTKYFKAKVNGTELTWRDDASMQLQGNFFYMTAYSGSGATVKAIILTIDNFTGATGTYSVTDSTDGNALYGYDQSGNEGGGEGEIKVTSFGAVGGVVVGTFHFKTQNYNITDGQFSVTRFQ